MAQQELGWMMLGASLNKFGSGGIAQSLMKPDMARAESWLNLLASGFRSESKAHDIATCGSQLITSTTKKLSGWA